VSSENDQSKSPQRGMQSAEKSPAPHRDAAQKILSGVVRGAQSDSRAPVLGLRSPVLRPNYSGVITAAREGRRRTIFQT
jgi:hypothetical protein